MPMKLSDAGMLVAQLIEDLIFSDVFDPRYTDMVRVKATAADFLMYISIKERIDDITLRFVLKRHPSPRLSRPLHTQPCLREERGLAWLLRPTSKLQRRQQVGTA